MTVPPKDVNTYLATLPGDMRAALEKLRKQIRAAAPKAEEGISYKIPTYKQNGMLVSFGAWKNHCALYGINLEAFKDELAAFDTSKGTIRFSPNKPLPAALVKAIIKRRIADNEATVAARKERARIRKSQPRESLGRKEQT